MKPTNLLRLVLLMCALVLTACGPGTLIAPVQGPTPPPELAEDTPGQAPPLEQREYTNTDFGFSLLYPAGFEVQQSFPHTVLFLAPLGTPGHRERAWLTVEAASDDAEWYADDAVQDSAIYGVEATSTVQSLDGQRAHILTGLTGQDPNRQVFIVKDGALFHMTFVPDAPAEGEAYRQMENIYAAILGSLRFLPERRAVPPIIKIDNMLHHLEHALNARNADQIALLQGNEFVLGELDPASAEGVSSARYASADVIPLLLESNLSSSPSVTLLYQVDWASVPGSLDTYAGFFPDESVTPILAKGWGPNGVDQAVIIISRRSDSSLYWSGAFVLR